MNKTILLLTFIFLSINISAQLSVGAKGGLTLPEVKFYPRIDQKKFQAYQAGIAFRYISEKHWGIQTEFNYVQKGWYQTSETEDYYNRIIDYYEVPILTHFYLGKQKFRFLINGGFVVSYANSAKIKAKFEGTEINKNYEFDNKVDKRWEYGITAGAGFEYRIKSNSIIFETRYYFAFTDVRLAEDALEMDYARNRYLGFTLAYMFTFRNLK